MTKGLTDRQKQVFDFICDTMRKEVRPPTVREIADNFGFRSPKAASDHLAALERKGYIARNTRKARNITVCDELSPQGIPVIKKIDPDKPLQTPQNCEGSVNVTDLFQVSQNTFAFMVEGNCMEKLGIFDGDYVIVEYGENVEEGEVAGVQLEGQNLIQRIHYKGNQIELLSEDGKTRSKEVDRHNPEFQMLGPVKGVIRKF